MIEIDGFGILALMLSFAAIAVALEAIRRLNQYQRAYAALNEQIVHLGVQVAKRASASGPAPISAGPSLRRAHLAAPPPSPAA
jgi:hypothetical protein